MAELLALGSDLNIKIFACNFRINGILNDDVEEANYLNKSIYEALSVAHGTKPVTDLPMFLSSTVFAVKEYGQCVQHYKRRLGLETDSAQDLFVLRNVVMSPFQTAGNFVQEIAGVFRGVLEKKLKVRTIPSSGRTKC